MTKVEIMKDSITNGKHIHAIGIGGIGLSALAQLLCNEGNRVSGCDKIETPWLDFLESKGLEIHVPHNTNHIDGADLVIHTLALEKTHSELKAAAKKGIPILSYPRALGEITKKYKTIAVAGSHGKTTVTSMIAKILIDNGKDPTVIVGAQSPDLSGNNFRKGNSEYFVIEACEYERAFLEYHPFALVITNIDHDHFDTYPTKASYEKAFEDLKKNVRENGIIIEPKTYENIQMDFDLQIPGEHNRKNAKAAFLLAKKLGIPEKDIIKSLQNYRGTGRRLEDKGEIRGVRIIDDYAHHPTEIKASLQAIREKYPKEKLWVVYQPHQFIRTKKLLHEFGPSFREVDRVIVPDIYDARDFGDAMDSVSVDDLVQTISKAYPRAQNGLGFEKTAAFLKQHWNELDVLIIMGAGDVWQLENLLINP